jgi:Uma2 family endonuclease
MATVLQLGPGDHGRMLSFDEFMAADYAGGFRYEIIEGRLYVSPLPNYPHDWVETYVADRLKKYAEHRPDVINRVSVKARVFVPGAAVTAPEPDIAAYRDLPKGPKLDWRSISPILVVEVLGGEDDDKDLVRNVGLYLRVPSIEEYWVIDLRDDEARPTMLVHRRRQDAWDVSTYGPDDVYKTSLLPGFSLPVAAED